jgi:hypothetical protein
MQIISIVSIFSGRIYNLYIQNSEGSASTPEPVESRNQRIGMQTLDTSEEKTKGK